MKADAFFLTFLDGIEEIIKSDKACVDIIGWAYKMSIAENQNSNIENVAAFLLLGLRSEISRLVSSVKRYQSYLYDGSGEISDEEWEAIDEKNELWDLEEILSALLSDIVKRVNDSDKKYSKAIKKHKNLDYGGSEFRLETVRKMRRYLEATILFLKSLDEGNIPREEREKYTSQLLGMGKIVEIKGKSANTSNEANEVRSANFIIGILETVEIIAFENHIPKVADTGVKFLKVLCQEELKNKLDNQLQITEDEAIGTFQQLNIIESDGRTITDTGLAFFEEIARDAFKPGFPLGVASMDTKEIWGKSKKDIEEIFKQLKGNAKTNLHEYVNKIMLKSARKILEDMDFVVMGWMMNNYMDDEQR